MNHIASNPNSSARLLDRTYSFYDQSTPARDDGNVMSITDNLNPGRSLSFGYDALSRVTSAHTATTSGADRWGQSYVYDKWGNLTQETPTQCSTPELDVTATVNNQLSATGVSYDAAGNTSSDGTHGYSFDAEGNLTQVDGGATAAYVYNAEGQRVQKTVGAAATQYVYFGRAPIAEYNVATGGWSDYIFANGQRLVMTAESQTPSAAVTNGSFENGSAGWNLAGNPVMTDTAKAHSGSNYVQISATAGNSAGIYAPQVAVTPGEELTFGGWAYVESGGGGALGWWLAVFDANRNAIAYVGLPNPGSGTWTYQTQTYTVPANAAKVMLYAQVYLPTSDAVLRVDDGFLYVNGSANFYYTDALGSVITITDGSGNPCYEASFTPYGQEMATMTACSTNYKFAGYERDPETGLDYAFARYYSSRLGRFLSPDPMAGGADDPQSLNRYAYVMNNATNLTDPWGLHPPPPPSVDGPVQCTIDDVPAPCEFAEAEEGAGAVAECTGSCGPHVGLNGDLEMPIATVQGWTWMDLWTGYIDERELPDLGFTIFDGGGPDTGGGGGPLHCNPKFIKAAKDAWMRSGDGQTGTEGGFEVTGNNSNPNIVPVPYTNEYGQLTIPTPGPNTIADFHTHPNGSSHSPFPTKGVDIGHNRPGDHLYVPLYTASREGLFISDPSAKDGYRKIRNGFDWMTPCK